MPDQKDVDYFVSREACERALASSAIDPSVRDAHFGLAERYADAIWAAEEDLDGPVRASGLWLLRGEASN